MEETKNKWVILIILAFVIVAMAVILPVVIASDYNQNTAGPVEWTPVVKANPTATPTSQPDFIEPSSSATPTAVVKKNCTYNAVYWMNHPESWPSQVIIGELNYTKEDAIVYMMNPVRDTPVVLFIQLHATFLNLLSGADPGSIEGTMVEASRWLSEHPIGSVVSVSDNQDGLVFVKILGDYNNGVSGPGHCEDEPLILLPTATPDLTLTSAYEQLPSPTITPTNTSTVVTNPKWTNTPRNTEKPDKTKPPKPTSTPAPTQPPPTATQPPTPTPAPTEPPG